MEQTPVIMDESVQSAARRVASPRAAGSYMAMQNKTEPQPASAGGEIEVVDGVLERITYVNEENGYTVARLKVPRYKKPVTIAGYLPAVSVGEGLRLEGKWVNHAQYGHQLMVTRYQSAMPSTVNALKKYLGSGLLKGVGPV